jgi:Fe-S oxidoreductase
VVRAVGVDRFTGPRSIAIELSRSPPEFWSTSDKVYLCTGCGTCREVCPKKVDIPQIVNLVRARIFTQRPDLVPKGLITVHEIILENSLAFEPWENPEEKVESRNMRLQRLGLPYIPDRRIKGARVLFYPGCQAEERAQEVRESAKLILNHFGVDYTVLEEMSCCGLPARLIGDEKAARELFKKLKQKIDDTGVDMVVTTCAGCTGNLLEMTARYGWRTQVFHMLEFLVQQIGLERIEREFAAVSSTGDPLGVAVHHPCHLVRHTSRQIADFALEILKLVPGVEVRPSDVSDSCCGGGGMVGYHSKDVADAVTRTNVAGIRASGADRAVTPCPLCTAQLESSFFRSGSAVEVDDLTVFIAGRLPLKR